MIQAQPPELLVVNDFIKINNKHTSSMFLFGIIVSCCENPDPFNLSFPDHDYTNKKKIELEVIIIISEINHVKVNVYFNMR